MNKQAPSTARILTMVAFAASCIGLLLFLWISFGGTTSLSPRGYEISAEFNQAENLGSQSDVRISGVSVGKVISVGLDRRTGLTRAVIQIDPQFAPRPANTRAILRQKSLLGETYVELSPGSATGPKLADGGTLPQGQVAPTVQLDQILSTFDPATRQAFETWQQQQGIALTNRGQDLNAALAQLYPFATNVDSVLAVLNRDSAATTTLLNDGGQVLGAVTRSPSALQGLVHNANTTFSATAAQAAALAATIKAFPAFLTATQDDDRPGHAVRGHDQAAGRRAAPGGGPAEPGARVGGRARARAEQPAGERRPADQRVEGRRARARAVPERQRPAADPADAVPRRRDPRDRLHQHLPARDRGVLRQRHGDHAGDAARDRHLGEALHYLRVSSPLNPETLTDYPTRLDSNRGNPYMVPGGYSSLRAGAARVRQQSVHEQPSTDDWSDYLSVYSPRS